MKTVYAVSEGSYSDYHVVAVFSSKEKAEEFRRLFPNADYNETEEYELDPAVVNLAKRGYNAYRIFMLRDGSVERAEVLAMDYYHENSTEIFRRSGNPYLIGKGKGTDVLNATVWAKSEKHAIKIVNEKRAQLIALGKWE